MKSRIERRDRDDIKYLSSGGILDLFDNQVKAAFRINDPEFDFIAEHATDEEFEILACDSTASFGTKRKILLLLDKYLTQYEKAKI